MQIYKMSRAFPREETYSLTDQVRRSSRSVCACVAEGWQKRRYPAAFTCKLLDAASEAGETRCWLEFAARCGFASEDEIRGLDRTYKYILGMLIEMASRPQEWRT
jgi:four helix bundle protein